MLASFKSANTFLNALVLVKEACRIISSHRREASADPEVKNVHVFSNLLRETPDQL